MKSLPPFGCGAVAVVLSLLFAPVPGPARPLDAQVAPADTAMVLYHLAADLRAEGRHADAELLALLVMRRYPGTSAATLAAELLADVRRRGAAGTGTAELVGWHTAFGAYLGVMVPAALGAEEPEPYGVGLLLGGPLGFAASRAYASLHPVTTGQALAMDFAGYWGTVQAVAWRDILDIGDSESCYQDPFTGEQCFDITPDEAPFAAAVAGGVAGIAAGAVLAGSRPVTTATALSLLFGSGWGVWYGAATAIMLGVDDDEAELAYAMVGGNLGLLGAVLGAPRLDWSTSRVWLVHLSGVAGLIGGLGLDLIVQPDDDAVAVFIPALGSALGLGVGIATTRDRDASGSLQSPRAASPSLLDWRDGRLALGVPLPVPALLPAPDANPKRAVPGLRFTLFQGRW